MEETTAKKKKMSLKTILRIVVILGLMGFATWSFLKYQKAQEEVNQLSNPEAQQEIIAREKEEILAKVGALMILPDDEEPTVATVTDAQALSQYQPFFRNASDGDIVILYVKSGKSIIYSEEQNIIVNVGTISVQGSAIPQLDLENPLRIELRMGGVSQERMDVLVSQLSDLVEITEITEAANGDYQGPILVAVTDNEARLEQAQILAVNLDVQLTEELPEGEDFSDAEIVLIVGN